MSALAVEPRHEACAEASALGNEVSVSDNVDARVYVNFTTNSAVLLRGFGGSGRRGFGFSVETRVTRGGGSASG